MSELPEGTAGKAAALAVLSLFVAVIYFAILSPVLAFYGSTTQALEQRRELARRYDNAVNDLPRLRELAKEAGERAQGDDMLLTGESDAVAAAELQSNLKELVEQEGAKITSAATLPAGDEGNFRRVGVRVAFSGDLPLLTTVLQSLEGARPLLTVGNFELRAGSNAGSEEENPNLTVALDVFGYREK